jgi:uncharacterized protein (TIGR00369 family)
MPEPVASRPTPEDVNAMVREAFSSSESLCTELGDGYAVASRIVDPTELRPGRFVPGPTQFALADAALWYLVFTVTGRIEPMALTAELSIRFLRPAVADVLWARATIDSAGRRNVVGTVRIWGDDREHKPTAVAQGTYVLPATG